MRFRLIICAGILLIFSFAVLTLAPTQPAPRDDGFGKPLDKMSDVEVVLELMQQARTGAFPKDMDPTGNGDDRFARLEIYVKENGRMPPNFPEAVSHLMREMVGNIRKNGKLIPDQIPMLAEARVGRKRASSTKFSIGSFQAEIYLQKKIRLIVQLPS